MPTALLVEAATRIEAAVSDVVLTAPVDSAEESDVLVAKVEQLAADLEAAERREAEIGERVSSMAKTIAPSIKAEDDEFAGEVAKVDAATEAFDETADADRAEALTGAIDSLLSAVERRAGCRRRYWRARRTAQFGWRAGRSSSSRSPTRPG